MALNEQGFDPELLKVFNVHELVGVKQVKPSVSRHAKKVYYTEDILNPFVDKRFFEAWEMVEGGFEDGEYFALLEKGDKEMRVIVDSDGVIELTKIATRVSSWTSARLDNNEAEIAKVKRNRYLMRNAKQGELSSVLPKLRIEDSKVIDETLLNLIPWGDSPHSDGALKIRLNLVNNDVWKVNEYNFQITNIEGYEESGLMPSLNGLDTKASFKSDLNILHVNPDKKYCHLAVSWEFKGQGVKSKYINLKNIFTA